eukprot:gene4698-5313_t
MAFSLLLCLSPLNFVSHAFVLVFRSISIETLSKAGYQVFSNTANAMGGAVSAGQDNDELVTNLCQASYIKSAQIEKVFRIVDRGDYFPGDYPEDAYKDLAWKQGNVHISAPCIYCEVMEAFELEEGLSFLNMGSGTGYLSTMVGLLVGPYGTNHGIELFSDVISFANEKLVNFMKQNKKANLANFCMPRFVKGNCLLINPSYRKYDRVYCGAACMSEHEDYFKSLIKENGILIVPIRDTLVKYKRISETEFEETTLLPVQFAPLIELQSQDLTNSIIEIIEQPHSLQEISRISILRSLGKERSRMVNKLPLPVPLIRFLDFYRQPADKVKKIKRKKEKQVLVAVILDGQ